LKPAYLVDMKTSPRWRAKSRGNRPADSQNKVPIYTKRRPHTTGCSGRDRADL